MSLKKKRSLSIIGGILILVLTISGTGTLAQKTTELTFWHHEAPAHRVAAFQQVIDLFEEKNPDVKVTQEIVMWGDAWVKTLAAIEAGNPPDFQFSIPDFLQTVYRTNSIIPLTEIAEELNKKYHFYSSQITPYYYKGEYWGIPVWSMVMLLTYRPSYLENAGLREPPKTWDELLDYAKKLTKKPDIYGIGLGGARNLMVDEQAYIFMTNVGAKFFDEKGKVIFNNPRTIKALKMYKDLFRYCPPGADAWSWGEMELNIAAGTVAMSPYFPSVQKRFYEEFDSHDYAGAHMPYPKDGQPGTITYPNEIHVYKQTKARGHLEATEKFIKFIMQPEVNYILTAVAEPGGFYPSTRAAEETPEFWKDPIIFRFKKTNEIALEALEYASLYGFEYGRWVNFGIGDITGADILADVVHKIVTGEMSVENAVKWGQKEMEKKSIPVK